MKICVLASGSKGNSTYIASTNIKLLVDLGTSCLYAERKLHEISVTPNQIDGILITHTQVDHTSGLKVFIKKYNTKLFLTEKMYDDLSKLFPITNYEIIEDDFEIQDVKINIIKTSHDASDSNGYIIENGNNSVVYITDTGYINQKYFKKLENRNIYIFESNHDVEMLMNGKYPYHIKQRIVGDRGHLSNKDSAYYLSKFVGDNTKEIVLAHLSEDNNTPVKATEMLNNQLEKENKMVENIIVATQHDRTELMEL